VKERELGDCRRDFQRKRREFQEDLNQRRNEELAQVLEQANRAIRAIAEQEKFDIIFQDAGLREPAHRSHRESHQSAGRQACPRDDMALTLAQIVARLGGRVAGDPQVLIRQVAPLEHAAAGSDLLLRPFAPARARSKERAPPR
jgi:hypothetical protein